MLARGYDLSVYKRVADTRAPWLSATEHRFIGASNTLQQRTDEEREAARQAEIRRQQELAEAKRKRAILTRTTALVFFFIFGRHLTCY